MAKKIIKSFKVIPENGIAIFCGQTDTADVSEVLNPPLPIKYRYYRCSEYFHVEQIERLYQTHDVIGYVVMTGTGALFATKTGPKVSKLRTIKAQLMTNTRRGGQSANRIARIRDEARETYYNKVMEGCLRLLSSCKSVFIGVTGEFKAAIQTRLESDSRWDTPVQYTKVSDSRLDQSLSELIEQSVDLIEGINRKQVQQQFDELYILITTTSLCVFGEDIAKYQAEYMLDRIYSYEKEEDCIYLPDSRLLDFGGKVGVLYYPLE